MFVLGQVIYTIFDIHSIKRCMTENCINTEPLFHAGVKFTISVAHATLTEEMI